jgi:hypothetical protein
VGWTHDDVPNWSENAKEDKGKNMRTYVAEFFGTFWLVLGGCGSAVLAATYPEVGIGLLGVSSPIPP